jgi:hypothetical protein
LQKIIPKTNQKRANKKKKKKEIFYVYEFIVSDWFQSIVRLSVKIFIERTKQIFTKARFAGVLSEKLKYLEK